MDGVLADFPRQFLEDWKNKHPEEMFVPTDKHASPNLANDYPSHLRGQVKEIYRSPGFFSKLPPIPGGIEAVKEMIATGYDISICTSPIMSYENCVLEKYKWIDKHLGRDVVRKIVMTRDKTLVRGDFLIDDNPVIIGSCKPEWEHILFTQPYNKDFPQRRIDNWNMWKEILVR